MDGLDGGGPAYSDAPAAPGPRVAAEVQVHANGPQVGRQTAERTGQRAGAGRPVPPTTDRFLDADRQDVE